MMADRRGAALAARDATMGQRAGGKSAEVCQRPVDDACGAFPASMHSHRKSAGRPRQIDVYVNVR
jgi:hypothetical protein